MSAFSKYAALSEYNAAAFRNESADALEAVAPLSDDGYPVSGDMLATIKDGGTWARTQRRKRAAEGRRQQ